jgi:hypothetical protein
VTCSFHLAVLVLIIYASAQANAVAAFPNKSRGAVNGLMSAVYAMSSGVCGALQAAFFRAPDASTVVRMLRSLALVALVHALCAAVAFPHTLGAAAYGGSATDERSGAGDDPEQDNVVSREDLVARGVQASLVSVRHGYFSATAVAVVLQLCAYVDWRGNMLLFGGRIRAEYFYEKRLYRLHNILWYPPVLLSAADCRDQIGLFFRIRRCLYFSLFGCPEFVPRYRTRFANQDAFTLMRTDCM